MKMNPSTHQCDINMAKEINTLYYLTICNIGFKPCC